MLNDQEVSFLYNNQFKVIEKFKDELSSYKPSYEKTMEQIREYVRLSVDNC